MRFERECHAMGAVSGHPNIVGVHEGGFTPDGRAYLVMEFYPGGSLLDRLKRDGPMTADDVLEIGTKIGRALGVAHDAGVLHRDVKPANILISAYGEPALADFGIARVEGGQQTATGSVTASFAHAAPEVLQGRHPTAASDLYSLGSTLYELFTGTPPHVRPDDESMWALVNRVVTQPVPDPASKGMPEPLASTVRRATLHEPQSRYQTATELVSDLAGRAAVTGAAPTPTPTPAPATAPVRSVPPDPPGAGRAVPPDPPGAGRAVPPDPPRSGLDETPTLSQHPVTDDPTLVQPTPERGRREAAPVGVGSSPEAGASSSGRRRRWPVVVLAAVLVAAIAGGWWFAVGRDDGADEVTAETIPPLPPVALAFDEGSTGPLDAGQAYELAVTGADGSATYRLVLDGAAIGEPVPQLAAYVPEAGRHSVAVEVTRGDQVDVTDPIEIYAIGEIPEPGWRVNLLSVTARPANWPVAIRQFDALVDAGHGELQLLPSDRFLGLRAGFWNVFVAGFGSDRASAVDYCTDFELSVPDECFVTFFDSTALNE